ncbi:MAG: hypothetical protein JNL28_06000 [Planctomycetes bacterium]|nr:hypothetical protein [Planctomycetota bacterium]
MTHLSRIGLSLAAVVACGVGAEAQVREAWRLVFDNGTPYSSDFSRLVAAHPAGGYVVAGSTTAMPAPSTTSDPLIVRVDSSGNVSWSRTYTGDPTRDGAGALGIAASGAIYVASSSGFFNNADVRLLKYDAAGNFQWFGGPYGVSGVDEYVSARELLIDTAENTYIGCSAAGAAIGTYNFVVLSYDSTGTQRFATVIDGPLGAGDALKAICRDSADNVFAVGSMDGAANGTSSLGLTKLNSSGAVQWTRVYDHTGPNTVQTLYSAVCDAAGNVYACGATGTAPASFASVLISYDSAGQFRWIRQVPGAANSIPNRVAIDRWGNLILVANSGPNGQVVKYDSAGNMAWQHPWLPVGYTSAVPHTVVVENGGDITIGGSVSNSGPSAQDLAVTQLDPNGNELWTRAADHNAQQEQFGNLIDSSLGRITATGWTLPYSVGLGYGAADVFAFELGDQSQPFCFGDGSGSACPCGNTSAPGAQVACLNSGAVAARLADTGDAGIANDTLVLHATEIPGPALFFQGTGQAAGGAGIPFGDGLLCIGGTITRMGIVFPTGTSAAYPGGTTGNPIHVAGATSAGDLRHYQAWYRDAAAFCTASTFNLTQGLSVTWAP